MRKLLFILLVLTHMRANTQDNIRFLNIDINSGISQSSVNAILQDQLGFVWFATQDGLNRFDGYRFKVYRNNPDNSNTISNNFVQCLEQDETGIIWVGTQSGLNSFDPETERFNRYAAGEQSGLGSNKITTVFYSGSHRLFIGTQDAGLYERTGESKFNKVKLDASGVRSVFEDAAGRIWVCSNNGLYLNNEGEYRRIMPNNIGEAWTITEDTSGVFWVGNINGLYRLTPAGKEFLFEEFQNITYLANFPGIRCLKTDGDNNIWVGTNGKGVFSFSASEDEPAIHRYRKQSFNPYSLQSDEVYCLVEDHQGILWIGTKDGVSRFDRIRQGFLHVARDYDNINSLHDNTIWSFQESSPNKLLIGTRRGVTLWNRGTGEFYEFQREANNPNTPNDNSVLSLCVDKQGNIYTGYVDGVFRLVIDPEGRGTFSEIKIRDNTPAGADMRVYAIKEDNQNRLWIGTREGLAVYDKKTGKSVFYRNNPEDSKSLPENMIRAVYINSQNDIWIGTDGGGLCRVIERNGRMEFIAFNKQSEIQIPSNSVLSVWEEKPGILWLGTYGGGLIRFDYKNKKYSVFSEVSHGLANDVIYGILGDNKNNLWLSTNSGLCRFNIKNLNVKNFKQKDGIQSNEFNIGAYGITSQGEFLFGGINGFNVFHPEQIRTNMFAPKMVFTDFLINNEPYVIGANSDFEKALTYTHQINLNHKDNKFTIEFAALHYSDPDGNQYKYKLVGIDKDYTYTKGGDRRANYSNLPPGEYTFELYGANSDGRWSKEPVKLKVVIIAPYWRTDWFQGVVILIILSATFYVFMRQVKEIRQQKMRLERLVEERTREVIQQKEKIEEQTAMLKMEKEKVEKLLLNVLPEQTADELKSKGKAQARSYKQVTIMFTDFKNFTKLAEQFRPPELVERLDAYFSKFDDIISKYQLEKIKTIGDAYMCAGGVPVRNAENPIYTTLAALEIQDYIKKDKEERLAANEIPWELRIGINTGEVVAGVIGSKRFAYDVWGNAVNVAARMETASEPGKVNVSGKTFELIEPFFECTYRGKIPAKNKGHIDMFFVERIKPELSVNGEGLYPSQAFWDYVNLHLFSSINYMKAERFIMKLLEKKLSPKLHYHSIAHTRDVTKAAERIALMEGVRGEDLFLLQTAATYHDAGFVERYEANEPIGVRMARDILPRYGYEPDQIDIVAGLIYATRIPHAPKSHLQEIICDADLDYLGRDDFHEIADKLRIELREHGKINSDRMWDEIQVKFLTQHKYFTRSAIKLRQEKKEKHIEEIKEKLKVHQYAD